MEETTQSKKILVIGIALFILLLIGFGVYYFATNTSQTKNNQVLTTAPESLPSNQQQTTLPPVVDITKITWQTKQVILQKETEQAGNESVQVTIRIPSDWTQTASSRGTSPNNIIKNCFDYTVLDNNAYLKLMIRPVCDQWRVGHIPLPSDAAVVNDNHYQTSNGHFFNVLRFFDTQTQKYKYVEHDKSLTQTMDAVVMWYKDEGSIIPAYITLDYFGPASQKETMVKITDEIIANLKAQSL